MKRIDAVNLAEKITRIMKLSAKEYFFTSLMGKTKFFEFLVFGSTARKCDSEQVGDLDMIIVADGCLPDSYGINHVEEDWYGELHQNITDVLGWIHCSDISDYELSTLVDEVLDELYYTDSRVDLHILPIDLFKNKDYRKKASMKHKDPNFFKNCFSSMMRFRNGEQFVPVGVSYFEYKYKCDLRDIKK